MITLLEPIPTPSPSVHLDNRVLEPDEQWKADLRNRIEHEVLHMIKDAQMVRNTILNSQPSERSRKLAQRDYEESMDNIRTMAREEFTRVLRQEMSERRRTVSAVDSTPFGPPNAPQNAAALLSTSPQHLLEREPLGDERSEHGYGTGGQEDEDEGSDGVWESDEGEDEDEGGFIRQLRSPLPPSFLLTQPLHSKTLVSQRNDPSRQRRQPDFQPAEDNDDDDADDPHRHPIRSPGGASRRQSSASPLRSILRAPEPSGIFRTFTHANRQEYSTDPVQFPRRGSSTGSTSGGARLHRVGSMNSDQHRSSSVAPRGDTERPSMQNRGRIASNVAARERRTSSSASPHDKPSPPSYSSPARSTNGAPPSIDEAVRFPISASPSRAIYGLQRSLTQTTPEEGLGRTSWGLLNSRRSSNDLNPTALEERPQGSSRASLNLRRSFNDLNQTTPEGSPGTSSGSLSSRHSFSELSQTTPEEGPRWTSKASLNLRRSSSDLDQTTPEGSWGTSGGSLNSRRSFGGSGRTTPEDGPQGTSWCSLNSHRSSGEFNVHRRHNNKGGLRLPLVEGDISDLSDDVVSHFDDEQSVRSMQSLRTAMSIERLTALLENEVRKKEEEATHNEEEASRKEEEARKREEVRKKEEEATRKEEEAKRREEEARRLEEKARHSLEEAKHLEAGARQTVASVKIREEAARKKEAKVRRKEAAVRKREADAQKREAETQLKEENVRFRELEALRKEEQARLKEEAAQRKEDDASEREEQVRRKEGEATRMEGEARRKEEELRRLEEQARRSLEEAKRIEAAARRAEASANLDEEADSAPVENEEAVDVKRDEMEVNFIPVASIINKN